MDAQTKISRSITKLLFRFPFWGALAIGTDFIEDNGGGNPTMCTNGRWIKWNRKFVDGISEEECVGVIVHELMHIILKHMLRRGNREPKKWNHACVAGSTLISMADGTVKPIVEVRAGDELVNIKGGTSIVERLINSGSKPMLRITLSNGSVIRCTKEHEVLTEDGFIKAGELRPGTACVVDARDGGAAGRPVKEHAHAPHRGRDGVVLPSGGEQTQANGDQGQRSGNGTKAAALHDPDRLGISGWADRRRGDHHGIRENREGSSVCAVQGGDHQHLAGNAEMAQGSGFQVVNAGQHDRELVFQDHGQRLEVCAPVAGGASLSGREATSGLVDAAMAARSATARMALHIHARHVVAGSADTGYEHARVEQVEECPDEQAFDLITDGHHYIANGIVVHNCDYAINLIVIKEGFKLPAGGLYDQQWLNMMAEKIYDKLPDPPEMPAWGSVVDADPEDAPEMEVEIDQRIMQAATVAKSRGNLPAFMEGILKDMEEAQIDWRDKVRRFLTGDQPDDYSFRRPERKYFYAMGIVAPSVERKGAGDIVIGIDTSGSVSDKELSHFLAEINAISAEIKPNSITLIYCDMRIHNVETHEAGDEITALHYKSRGGTLVMPVFDHVREKNLPCDHMIYLTDLEVGDWPKSVDFPLLWVSSGGPGEKAPIGETVRINVK